MLVLTRKIGEEIIVGDGRIRVVVLDAKDRRVKLGISAPEDISIHRGEVIERRRAREAQPTEPPA